MSDHDTPPDEHLLAPIREHLAAEAARDVDWTLRTVTPDCRYEFPLQSLSFAGEAKLRIYYSVLFGSRPGKTAASRISRYWVSGADTVIAECAVTYQSADGASESRFVAVFGIADGRVASEIVYVTQHQDWVDDIRPRLEA